MKLYRVLIIVLPLFVGSLAIGDFIAYICGNGTVMNPIISVGLAVVGMITGITNILKLLE